MDKALASAMMTVAKSLDKQLGELDALISQIPHDGERKQYARALGNVMGSIAKEIIFRIEREHPDLNPDK
jgi:hypothetical protein